MWQHYRLIVWNVTVALTIHALEVHHIISMTDRQTHAR